MPPDDRRPAAPRVAVVLGGKNAVYKFTDADDDRLAGALASLAALGASFMITPSRRTHQRLIARRRGGDAGAPRSSGTATGDNPYPEFLAHADVLVVTADSVNMTGEACATGRPVYVFEPSGGSQIRAASTRPCARSGATRPLPSGSTGLKTGPTQPLDSARIDRGRDRAALARRQRMLPGAEPARARSDAGDCCEGRARDGASQPRQARKATPLESRAVSRTRSCRAFCRPRASRINATYPEDRQGRLVPDREPRRPAWRSRSVIDELDGPAFEEAIAEKFDVDLDGRPKMYSLRGYTRAKDGQIHTDSKDKIITVLLYLNENWTAAGRPPAHPAQRPRRRRLRRRGAARQRHAAGVQALGQLLARPPPLRGPAPLAADELDDERGLEGLPRHPPQDLGGGQEADGGLSRGASARAAPMVRRCRSTGRRRAPLQVHWACSSWPDRRRRSPEALACPRASSTEGSILKPPPHSRMYAKGHFVCRGGGWVFVRT